MVVHHKEGPRTRGGFTMVEMLIVVAIASILAAIAIPGYAAYIRKSSRAQAQAFMNDVAARQQQYLVDKRAYAPTIAALNVTIPSTLTSYFTFTLTVPVASPPQFTLTATAIGSQTADLCTTMTINYQNSRTPQRCW